MTTTVVNSFVSDVKKQAQILHAIYAMEYDKVSLAQYESPIKFPTLQQCYEITAKGYGYSTYKGLLEAEDKFHYFNFSAYKSSITACFIKNNSFDGMSLTTYSQCIAQGYDVVLTNDEILGCVDAFMLSALPPILDLKKPKANYFADTPFYTVLEFSQLPLDYDAYTLVLRHLLCLVVESIDTLDIERNDANGERTVRIPFNILYKHKLKDLPQVKNIIKTIIDLFNQTRLVRSASEVLNPENPSDSLISISIDESDVLFLKDCKKLHGFKENALDVFHTLLTCYPKQLIDFTCIDKLSIRDTPRYYLLRMFFFTAVCERHAYWMESDIVSIHSPDLEKIIEALNPHQSYVTDAVIRVDDHINELAQLILSADQFKLEIQEAEKEGINYDLSHAHQLEEQWLEMLFEKINVRMQKKQY